jgi:hypothetical protein
VSTRKHQAHRHHRATRAQERERARRRAARRARAAETARVRRRRTLRAFIAAGVLALVAVVVAVVMALSGDSGDPAGRGAAVPSPALAFDGTGQSLRGERPAIFGNVASGTWWGRHDLTPSGDVASSSPTPAPVRPMSSVVPEKKA